MVSAPYSPGLIFRTPSTTGWSGTHAWFSPTPVVDHGDERVEVDYWRVLGGLKGDFGEGGPFPGWTWDAYVQHSDSKGEYTNQFVRQDSIQDKLVDHIILRRNNFFRRNSDHQYRRIRFR